MNVGRLGRGRGEYYLVQVADGVEDYYTERGEAPGEWLGGGTAALGLDGGVEAEDLRQVLEGRSPDGAPLGRPGRKTPGFDVTFRAPKSVSLLFALADAEVSREVRAAHASAVGQAVDYLERVACVTRRGPQGRETIRGHGFVAAGFQHRTSRAGDPLLHTHVLIANAVQGIDGRWSALDARHLYRQVKTGGTLYQAALRAELTRRLGVAWQPMRNGVADVDGIDRRVIEEFSQRRRQILEVLAERGETSGRAAQIATLTTRQAKPDGDWGSLVSEWRRRASAAGFTSEVITTVIHRMPRAAPLPGPVATAEELVGPAGLTGRRSTFTRSDVLQAWCNALPAGAAVVDVEALADGLLDHDQVVTLAGSGLEAAWRRGYRDDGRPMPTPGFGAARYTTVEMRDVEATLVDTALAREHDGVGVAAPSIIDAAVALRPMLTLEQQHAVFRLTGAGAGVDVVVGKAGAGKTTVLDTARAAWQTTGHTVIGCALSARAAAELQDTAGIPSATIHRLTAELTRTPLPHGAVLVVDEAAMVGTRTLDHLHRLVAAAGGKLVLVGDDRQLPAIDAGGGFRALTRALTPIELTDNRRQQHQWERDALDQLRHGHVDTALTALRNHGRVTIATSTHDARHAMVHDWHRARQDGLDAPMLALHRSDVDDLNQRARRKLIQYGELGAEQLNIGGRCFAVGDQVVGRRNDYRTGILNGTRATVTAIHPDAQTLTIQPHRRDQQIRLPRSYLRSGHLDHGYALTVHKAQGATWDEAFVLGSDRLHREAGYVAFTRARNATWLYTVGSEPDEHATHQLDPDHLTPLRRALRASHAEPSIRELDPQPMRSRSTGISPT